MTDEILLALLRAEHARMKLAAADAEAIGLALKGGLITAEQAIVHMRHMNLIGELAEQAMKGSGNV
jgi:hypothetical protein